MDESEIYFQDTEDDELEVQDEDSEVRLLKREAVIEKFYNLVVGHLGYDRTYKALKLSGHNWVGIKDN